MNLAAEKANRSNGSTLLKILLLLQNSTKSAKGKTLTLIRSGRGEFQEKK